MPIVWQISHGSSGGSVCFANKAIWRGHAISSRHGSLTQCARSAKPRARMRLRTAPYRQSSPSNVNASPTPPHFANFSFPISPPRYRLFPCADPSRLVRSHPFPRTGRPPQRLVLPKFLTCSMRCLRPSAPVAAFRKTPDPRPELPVRNQNHKSQHDHNAY